MTRDLLLVIVHPFTALFMNLDLIKGYLWFLSLINTKSISEDEKVQCDNSICIEEVLHAIKELKLNKSPGVDGLTSEFYKSFSCSFSLKTFFSEYRPWKASTHPHSRLNYLNT